MPRELNKDQEIVLLDVLDAVLEKGVVLRGDIMISIADIDLVYLDLRILLSSVESLVQDQKDSKRAQKEAAEGAE